MRYTVALYAVFSFAVVSENEMYNLWAASAKDLGKYLLLKYSLILRDFLVFLRVLKPTVTRILFRVDSKYSKTSLNILLNSFF